MFGTEFTYEVRLCSNHIPAKKGEGRIERTALVLNSNFDHHITILIMIVI